VRAVVDTNVLIAGLLWRGPPHALLDDQVLALAAKAELIVSGDADLLSLGSVEGMPIVAPAEAVRLLVSKAP
jgi:predicted nucleic acid-binding protein